MIPALISSAFASPVNQASGLGATCDWRTHCSAGMECLNSKGQFKTQWFDLLFKGTCQNVAIAGQMCSEKFDASTPGLNICGRNLKCQNSVCLKVINGKAVPLSTKQEFYGDELSKTKLIEKKTHKDADSIESKDEHPSESLADAPKTDSENSTELPSDALKNDSESLADAPTTDSEISTEMTDSDKSAEVPSDAPKDDSDKSTDLPSDELKTNSEQAIELPSDAPKTDSEKAAELPSDAPKTDSEKAAELPSDAPKTDSKLPADAPPMKHVYSVPSPVPYSTMAPPVSTPCDEKPPASTPCDDNPPASTTPCDEKPPASTPCDDNPPASTTPCDEKPPLQTYPISHPNPSYEEGNGVPEPPVKHVYKVAPVPSYTATQPDVVQNKYPEPAPPVNYYHAAPPKEEGNGTPVPSTPCESTPTTPCDDNTPTPTGYEDANATGIYHSSSAGFSILSIVLTALALF